MEKPAQKNVAVAFGKTRASAPTTHANIEHIKMLRDRILRDLATINPIEQPGAYRVKEDLLHTYNEIINKDIENAGSNPQQDENVGAGAVMRAIGRPSAETIIKGD